MKRVIENAKIRNLLYFLTLLLFALTVFLLNQFIAKVFPFLSIIFSWLWISLPGILVSRLINTKLSWIEHIPFSFVLGISIATPYTIVAILLKLTLNLFLLLSIFSLVLVIFIYLIYSRNKRNFENKKNTLKPGQPLVITNRSLLLAYIFLLVFLVGALVYLAASWPPAGDDLAGLPIFAESLQLGKITGTEPFHGSNTPVTPRNELIVFGYLSILACKLSTLPADIFLVLNRPLFIILSIITIFAFLKHFFKNINQALFILCLWCIFLLSDLVIEGTGSDFITRIFQDKFFGWFVLVPIILIYMLWFLESQSARYLIGFGTITFASALVHPITLMTAMIICGSYGILHFILNPSKNTFKILFQIAIILIASLIIPIIQYYRYSGLMPIDVIGFTDAITFSRYTQAVDRYRIWLLDRDRYILHPSIILNPLNIIAYLSSLIIFIYRHKSNAAQLIFGSLIMLLALLYIPPLASLTGNFVTPFLLWRLAWPITFFNIISLSWFGWIVLSQLGSFVNRMGWIKSPNFFNGFPSLGLILVILISSNNEIKTGLVNYNERKYELGYSTCTRSREAIYHLNDLTKTHPATVLASRSLNYCIPGFAPLAHVIEFRGLGTVNRLPIDQAYPSLQRVYDASYFSSTTIVDHRIIEIIKKYRVEYLLIEKNKIELDLQISYMPDMFSLLYFDENTALYKVNQINYINPIIQGNTLLRKREWSKAEKYFSELIHNDPTQLLAYVGQGLAYEGIGNVNLALKSFEEAKRLAPRESTIFWKLGNLYLFLQEINKAIEYYQQAISYSPQIPIFYTQLGIAYSLSNNEKMAMFTIEHLTQMQTKKNSAAYYSLLGRLCSSLSHYDKSIANFQKAATIEPTPYVYLDLAQVYLNYGNRNKAIQTFQKAIEMDPWFGAPHAELGQIYHKENNIELAAKEYTEAWRLNPVNTATYILLAQVYLDKEGLQEAITKMQKLSLFHSTIPGPHRSLVPLYTANSAPENAINELDISTRLQPMDASIDIAKGTLYSAIGKPDNAQESYINVEQYAPELKSLKFALSVNYAQNLDYAAETGQLVQISQRIPMRAWPHLYLAQSYKKQGDLIAMKNQIDWAIEIEPDDSNAYLALGNYYQSLAEWEDAIESYEYALTLDPQNQDVYIQLGRVYQNLADYTKAEEYYKLAIEINKNNIFAYEKLARNYWLQNEYAEAIEVNEAIIDDIPKSSYGIIILAQTYSKIGKYEEARTLYEQAIQTDLTQIEAYSAIAQMELEHNLDLQAALNSYQEAINANPASSVAYLNVGKFLLSRGEYASAEDTIQKSLLLPGVTPDNYAALSGFYLKIGEREKAGETLEDSTRIFPSSAIALTNLAKYQWISGKESEAEINLQKAISLGPNFMPAYQALAKIWQERGEITKAEKLLSDALTKNPGSDEAYINLAAFQEIEGNISSAEINFQHAIDIAPANISNYLDLADFYQRHFRFSEAQDILDKALAIQTPTIDLFSAIAKHNQSINQPEIAIQWYQKAIDFDKSHIRTYLELSKIYQQLGDWQQAENALNIALSSNPASSEVHYNLGLLYQQYTQKDLALQEFRTAAELNKNNVQYIISTAEILGFNQNWSEAVILLKDAIDISPGFINTYQTLSDLYQKMGNQANAEQTLTSCIDSNPYKGDAYVLRADHYKNQGKWEQAKNDYETAWQLEPKTQNIATKLAEYYVDIGNYDSAIIVLDQAVKQSSVDSPAYILLGDIYTTQAKWDEAFEAYGKAIKLGYDDSTGYTGLGNVYKMQGDNEKALIQYQQAVSSTQTDSQAWINLANFYTESQQYTEAENIYKNIVSSDPSNTTAWFKLDEISRILKRPRLDLTQILFSVDKIPSPEHMLSLASLYQKRGEWDISKNLIEKALSLDPYNIAGLIALGDYYQSTYQYEEALSVYQEILKISPTNAAAYNGIATTNQSMDLTDEAEISFTKAIEVEPTNVDSYINLAHLHGENDQHEEAILVMHKAKSIFPGDYRVYQASADTYELAGYKELSLEILKEGYALIPGASELMVSIGDWYKTQLEEEISKTEQNLSSLDIEVITNNLNFIEAQSAYMKALELQPNNENAVSGIGRLNLLIGDLDEALVYFELSTLEHPDSINALIDLANINIELDRVQEAIALLQQARKISPNNNDVLFNLYNAYLALSNRNNAQSVDLVEISQFLWNNQIGNLREREARKQSKYQVGP